MASRADRARVAALPMRSIMAQLDGGMTLQEAASKYNVSVGTLTRKLDQRGYERKDKRGFTIGETAQRVTIDSNSLRRVLAQTNSIPETAKYFRVSEATIRNRIAFYGLETPKGARRGREAIDIPKLEILDALKATKYNVSEAAKRLNVSSSTVRSRILDLGIEMPDPCEIHLDMPEVIQTYRSGVSLPKIAAHVGKSATFVRKCLDEANVRIRQPGRISNDREYAELKAFKRQVIIGLREIKEMGQARNVKFESTFSDPSRDFVAIEALYVGLGYTPKRIAKELGITEAQATQALDFIRAEINPNIDAEKSASLAELKLRQNEASYAEAQGVDSTLERVGSFALGYTAVEILDRTLSAKNEKFKNASAGVRATSSIMAVGGLSAATYALTRNNNALFFAGGGVAQALISNYIIRKVLP